VTLVSRLPSSQITLLARRIFDSPERLSLLKGKYLYKKSKHALIAKTLVSSMQIISAFTTKFSKLGQYSRKRSVYDLPF
jgi:ribosome-associated toxin RatA of RatAB toxin-antitoxin module